MRSLCGRGRRPPLPPRVAAQCLPALLLAVVAPSRAGSLRLHRQGDGESPPTWQQVHKELYPVKVNFDIEEFEPSDGVTMVFAKQEHAMRLDLGIAHMDGLAWGRFDEHIEESGWSELYVETGAAEGAPNDAKMYAAGFLEGLLTCVRLSEFYANSYQLLLKKASSTKAVKAIKKYFKKSLDHMQTKTNLRSHTLAEQPDSAYWKQVRYVLIQMWGVCDGYNFAARHFGVHTLGLEDMLFLNSGGELPQVMEALVNTTVVPQTFLQLRGASVGNARMQTWTPAAATGDVLDDAHWERRLAASGHCTGFVRVSGGNEDLFVGHTTWDDYSRMTRIFKYYKFALAGADTMASHIGFSSYPGAVSSTDSFYVMDSGLAVAETSLMVLDTESFRRLASLSSNPRLPAFVHVMAVNRLAKDSRHWSELYEAEAAPSTPAYAAQWLVVDYNRFEKSAQVQDGTLWVVESFAATCHAEDLSEVLQSKGYFPSFNRPYFDQIRQASGHASAERSHGTLYSWASNPRAEIFSHVGSGTNTLSDMRNLMSRNQYPAAGVVNSGPGHEISARMDLSTDAPLPNGGIDAKVTGRCLMARLQVQALSSPSHQRQQIFSWVDDNGTDVWPEWPRVGLPDKWGFGFVQMTPGRVVNVTDDDDC